MKTALLTIALALATTLGFSQAKPIIGSGIYYKYLMETEMEIIWDSPAPEIIKAPEAPTPEEEWSCFRDDGKNVEPIKEGKKEE